MLKLSFRALFFLTLSASIAACDSSSISDPDEDFVAERVLELPADPITGFAPDGRPIAAGVFTYFSLANNAIVANADSATTAWDIAFKGTTIIVNGGISGPGNGAAQVLSGLFSEVMMAPETGWNQDGSDGNAIPTGSGNGWYNYEPTTNAITPIPGRVVLIRTADGRYAKISMVNYYRGLPEVPDPQSESRYITFDFVFQPDGSRSFE